MGTNDWLSTLVVKISLLLGGDGGVARDELGEDAAAGLDADRERRHVEQQHLVDLAGQRGALDRGADGDHLVGVHALVRLAPEELLHRALHGRHARHAADEDHLADVFGADARVFERAPARVDGARRRDRP